MVIFAYAETRLCAGNHTPWLIDSFCFGLWQWLHHQKIRDRRNGRYRNKNGAAAFPAIFRSEDW